MALAPAASAALAPPPPAPAAPPQALERAACTYTACYCEENALLLSKRLAAAGAAPTGSLYLIFVSNPRRQAPLWRQRSSSYEDGLVVWDYHVSLSLNTVMMSVAWGL